VLDRVATWVRRCVTRLSCSTSQGSSFSHDIYLYHGRATISTCAVSDHSVCRFLSNLAQTEIFVMDVTTTLSDSAGRSSIDKEQLSGYLTTVGLRFYDVYMQFGKLEQIDNAIKLTEAGLELTKQGDKTHARHLYNLAVFLGTRFERSGEMQDLEEAINTARQAVQSTPPDHPKRAMYLKNLGSWLGSRFEQSGEMKDLEEAIDTARQAVQLTPPGHPNLAIYLNNLGNILRSRFERSGEMKDLEEAIDTARQAVQSTPPSHPNLAIYLNNLGDSLGRRFEQSGEMQDLEEAINTARQAMQSNPPDHPNRAMYLNNLGKWLVRRFEQSGETKDLEEAINTARQAVESTPSDHPSRAMYLNNLGNSLGTRFKRSGEMKDLEEAITTARQAVQSTPPDHLNRAIYLNGLGLWLGRRFERSGEIRDLEEAINIARQVVELTPPDHPSRAMYLNNLGNSLGTRFERSGEMKYLKEAINTARQAVQSTPPNHPSRAMYLNNLGSWLGRRFERSGEMKDLEEAIDTARQAVQSTPPDHPNRAMYLNNLGLLLRRRFEQSGEMKDLEEAIDTARQAVQSTPPGHPNLAIYLNNLGNMLGSRFEQSGEMKDLEGVTECYLGAFHCTSAVPLERVKAAARCLGRLADLRKTHEAITLGREALELLPIVNNRNLDRSDQQFALSGFAGIASDLCALLLSEGCVHEAVERLEQGRATIISRLLDDRSDVSGLCQEHPKLAEHYQSLVAEVNTPYGSTEDKIIANAKVMRRREATTELEACLRDIRAIPGHERYLLGQTVAEMQEGMSEGYVAIVNISQIRSDAIVMTQDTLQAIPLSGLNMEEARRWLRTEWRHKKKFELRKKNDEFLEYLTWLWRICVKHILDHVFALYRGHQASPRVWWIGCGLASSMPFHAAGIHANASRDNALNKVVSSYTPSVKALGYARRQIKRVQNDQPTQDQMLITLMPETPQGANDKTRFRRLEGVLKEEEMIVRIVSPYVNPVVRTRPDADNILGLLETCRMAHFACHGMSNPTDPSSSGLVLQRLASDGTLEQDHLSVSRISHLRLKHAQIAYLSACSTAENKAARLQDEVIHIVSGFQVAGFPHVIGSLWPAGDDECVEVARVFYSSLFKHKGVPELESRRVAWALREAVMKVRAKDMDMPLNWAQFVHFGA
jgi:tetratricopeptide (TPR) repeat protein